MNDCKNANDEIFVNGELTTAENTATNEETSSAELLATEIAASVETGEKTQRGASTRKRKHSEVTRKEFVGDGGEKETRELELSTSKTTAETVARSAKTQSKTTSKRTRTKATEETVVTGKKSNSGKQTKRKKSTEKETIKPFDVRDIKPQVQELSGWRMIETKEMQMRKQAEKERLARMRAIKLGRTTLPTGDDEEITDLSYSDFLGEIAWRENAYKEQDRVVNKLIAEAELEEETILGIAKRLERDELPPQPAKEGEFNEERFVRASLIEAGLERAEEEPQPPQYDEETLLTTILMTIGINPASYGFACFKRAIRLFLDGKTRMGEVHKVLAKEFGRTAMAIERNMRMTLVSAHSRGRLITFNSLVLIDAVDERYGITPKEFIATAAEYVKNDYLREEVLIPNLTRRLKSLSAKYSEGEKE